MFVLTTELFDSTTVNMSSADKLQKALFIPKKQAPFALGTQEIQVPGPGELLVRIQSTALNPVDWKIQVTGYFIENYPAILGTDSAGVVAAVGEGVTNFAVGDNV